MAYLEELLPEFRNGAKIRSSMWSKKAYIHLKDGKILDESGLPYTILAIAFRINDWELYQEPIDWDYITKNKCLCWFWDNDDKYKSIEKLACINDKADYPFENIRGAMYRHCHPVLKDEVTFYEDKNNE